MKQNFRFQQQQLHHEGMKSYCSYDEKWGWVREYNDNNRIGENEENNFNLNVFYENMTEQSQTKLKNSRTEDQNQIEDDTQSLSHTEHTDHSDELREEKLKPRKPRLSTNK